MRSRCVFYLLSVLMIIVAEVINGQENKDALIRITENSEPDYHVK